ncbi:Phenol 2-monooxygenase [Leucoagaricus sp. SymC.cos]|nr:Phenol 2-monooxygenase [Leucoagaricus sp. SymC.cos]
MPLQPYCVYVDVLVIGAGPAGLMLANTLGRLGVSVKIIDRRKPQEVYGRADGIQPGTIEVWNSYGLSERLLREGCHIYSFVNARYPFEVTVPIQVTEKILRDSAKEFGVRVDQPLIPKSLQIEDLSLRPSDYPISVCSLTKLLLYFPCSTSNNKEQSECKVYTKYLVGCDGGHSWVREMSGIKMNQKDEDNKSTVNWGVIDFTPEGNFPDVGIKNIIESHKHGVLGWIPHPDRKARLYIPLPPGYGENRLYTSEEFLASLQQIVDEVASRAIQVVYKLTQPSVVHPKYLLSIYPVRQQVAQRFSIDNRIFIAGDACHTHSPKAGQGANVSMRDSHNLGWKLAYVLKGWADLSLLSTYDEERRSIAEELITLNKDRFVTLVILVYEICVIPQALVHRLTVGERIPPCTIFRLNDWNPFNIQDLIPFDGSFKLLIFPGNIALQEPLLKLRDYVSQFEKSYPELYRKREKFLTILTIVKNPEVTIQLRTLPGALKHDSRVYSDVPLWNPLSCNTIYQEYGIDKPIAVLTRPDAHIAVITGVEGSGVQSVVDFLSCL